MPTACCSNAGHATGTWLKCQTTAEAVSASVVKETNPPRTVVRQRPCSFLSRLSGDQIALLSRSGALHLSALRANSEASEMGEGCPC